MLFYFQPTRYVLEVVKKIRSRYVNHFKMQALFEPLLVKMDAHFEFKEHGEFCAQS